MGDPKEVCHRFVGLRNGKDINALVALYADDGALEFPGRGQIKGEKRSLPSTRGISRPIPMPP